MRARAVHIIAPLGDEDWYKLDLRSTYPIDPGKYIYMCARSVSILLEHSRWAFLVPTAVEKYYINIIYNIRLHPIPYLSPVGDRDCIRESA